MTCLFCIERASQRINEQNELKYVVFKKKKPRDLLIVIYYILLYILSSTKFFLMKIIDLLHNLVRKVSLIITIFIKFTINTYIRRGFFLARVSELFNAINTSYRKLVSHSICPTIRNSTPIRIYRKQARTPCLQQTHLFLPPPLKIFWIRTCTHKCRGSDVES